jgi:D-alanine-D-alanine ligase
MTTDTKTNESVGNTQKVDQKEKNAGADNQINQKTANKNKSDLKIKKPRRAGLQTRKKHPNPTPRLSVSPQSLRKLKLVAIAYSHVEREYFSTDAAYEAELEVKDRAKQVQEVMEKLNIQARLYSADDHFLTNLLVDRPDMVINLVDTLKGKDSLQTAVAGALEMVGIPYTGANTDGLVIGNNRNLFKQILQANNIPTPAYQYIQRSGTNINPELGLPLIVKLNEGGGSLGIDNHAVKETIEDAQKQAGELMSTYHLPVIVERFIDGPEITAIVFDDGRRRHVFLGQKDFRSLPDGVHEFTSRESYDDWNSYLYKPVQNQELAKKIEQYVIRIFGILHHKDYSKFDIRVEKESGIPYFTDSNPNTAFGPDLGLPFTDILQTLYGVKFEKVLMSLLSKYAKKTTAKS